MVTTYFMENIKQSEIHANIQAIQSEVEYLNSLINTLEDKLGFVIQSTVPSNNSAGVNPGMPLSMQSGLGSVLLGVVQDLQTRNARLQDLISRVQL